ncbi:MAG TPA: ribbon-helix-helix protein, CopG family [Acetobacteraceae bacterium]|nr:ribbon-helix-helix protein, CopG family [Acetobacteraceae bacterium]
MSDRRHTYSFTLRPDLVERAARLADAADRSRSHIVERALAAYCDAVEIPRGALADTVADAAGGGGAPSPATSGAPYPAGLHVAAMHRQAAARRAQDDAHAEARDRAMHETAENLKGLPI